MEHVDSFRRYSQFRAWGINTAYGLPPGLNRLRFQIIILHYSLFNFTSQLENPVKLGWAFLKYLKNSKSSYKIAFFQDEHHFCQQRFAFLNRFHIDCVYTLLDPAYYKDVYLRYTNVPKLVHTLTGYVSDDLVKKAQIFAKPDYARNIDVGYRGRQLKFYMGKGSQDKYEIAVRFRERAMRLGLKMDIETEDKKRLYGDAWYRSLGDCKACLGVEAGVSIFDTEDVVRKGYELLIAENPKMTFEEMSERLLNRWEGNIPYRTISPRHFEAAAFRICQILYEGDYQGIMKPMVHYIPLKEDFSNFDEVIRLFRDDSFRHQITENCYHDLIASGEYSYQNFVESFDQELLAAGFTPQLTQKEVTIVSEALSHDRPRRWIIFPVYMLRSGEYPGRKVVVFLGRPVLKIYRRVLKWLETSRSNRLRGE